jgi:hypothetical protein
MKVAIVTDTFTPEINGVTAVLSRVGFLSREELADTSA